MVLPITYWHIASPDEPTASLVLPPRLYYVRHGRSQACPLADGGFSPRNPNHKISTEKDLKKHAREHFWWPNWTYESCFVSVFGDRTYAHDWANSARLSLQRPIRIYELDTAKLPPGTLVLNAYMLCAHLGLKHSINGEGSKDEFLFYKGIPGCSITKSWDPTKSIGAYVTYDYQVTWDSVIKRAERLQDRHNGQLADTNRDADINNLPGQMGALGLQNNVRNKASTSTASANAVQNVATPARASNSTSGARATTPQNPRSAATTEKELMRKVDLETARRHKATERPRTNTPHYAQDAEPSTSHLDEPGQNKKLELKGTLIHAGSSGETSSKVDPSTKLNTNPAFTPHTAVKPMIAVPTAGDTSSSISRIATCLQKLYEQKKQEIEQVLLEKDVLLVLNTEDEIILNYVFKTATELLAQYEQKQREAKEIRAAKDAMLDFLAKEAETSGTEVQDNARSLTLAVGLWRCKSLAARQSSQESLEAYTGSTEGGN
ncbi:hypothetical protein B0T20DRAFT_503975 [Sordaria brevicollis]|uniref:DUF7587 domain-containing protein n=1 Tax=Sordaria brevicollis TaxID=83679 RepID=A0AAE0UER3_SORBR|nr:hypothetical protein B0T20DRAFT_503975 [Sordaria brevicollis]